MTDRITMTVPDMIPMPRLFDYFELQGEEHTQLAPFYERLADGDLSTTRCDDCEKIHFPPRIVCPACMGDSLSYESLPSVGTLHTFTEVRAGAPLGMEDEVPFVVGIVDLGSVKLSARIEEATDDELTIGDEVELVILDIEGPGDEERVFYRFTPVS